MQKFPEGLLKVFSTFHGILLMLKLAFGGVQILIYSANISNLIL